MKPFSRLNRFLKSLPLHVILITLVLLWVLPTVGLFVTSFRPREAVRTTGWWTVFFRPNRSAPGSTPRIAPPVTATMAKASAA